MSRRATQIAPPLQVVTGKGGVGKSTFAAALALAAAREGREVLAIEMGQPAGLAAALEVRPEAHGVPLVAAPHLSVAFFDGEAALAEYLGRFLFWRVPLRRVVRHPLYRTFVSAGPGVRELLAIGKVRDELLGLSAGRPQWDLIVLDAGASGHALPLLGMAAASARTFSRGLAHREATRVAGVLADPRQTAIHVVALPEHMPLEEAEMIIGRLRGDLQLPMGRLIVNQCKPPAPAGAAEVTAALERDPRLGTAGRRLALEARRTLNWLRAQEEGIATLERRVGLRAQRLPRLLGEPLGRTGLEALAAHVGLGGIE